MTHNLCQKAMEMNVVPGIHTLVIITYKLATTNYVTMLYKNGANIYDGKTVEIPISEKAVLKATDVNKQIYDEYSSNQ